jgi:hypothetical protein
MWEEQLDHVEDGKRGAVIKERERAVLKTVVPAEGSEVGNVGKAVHLYGDGRACEVGFVTLDGKTAAVATLEASQVRTSADAKFHTLGSWLLGSRPVGDHEDQLGQCLELRLSSCPSHDPICRFQLLSCKITICTDIVRYRKGRVLLAVE